jgi:short-subunit dehydrogenase
MKQKQWALVTGASSGLGVEFAKALAKRGFNLVLTARRIEPMIVLAKDLRGRWNVDVVVEGLDLSEPQAPASLMSQLTRQGIDLQVLINNAGFGLFGPFLENETTRLRQMLEVDVLALTELSLLAGQSMKARREGHILLVASVAAFQPTPLYAAYGAAKAYVLSLGEALNVELAPDVGVTVLLPGLMDTGFLAVAGQEPSALMKRNMVEPGEAVRIGLDAMFARKPSAIVGALNKISAFASRFFTRHAQARMILRVQQN